MKKKGNHLRKREFSKVISSIGIAFWIFVNVFGMVMILITLDLSPLPYLIGSANAVAAIIYPVYAHKAKAENMIKLKKLYGDDADVVINNAYKESDPVVDFDMSAFNDGILKF